MSFLNFFKKKSKTDDKIDEDNEVREGEVRDRKLKKQLSISRSGRYKQKARHRGGVADRPELFHNEDDGTGQKTEAMKPSGSSPNGSCREVKGKVIPGGMRLNEQMAS